MKVAIYNLHFATMGGGEKRTAVLAAHLCAKHEVVLFVTEPLDRKRIGDAFAVELAGVEIVPLDGCDHFQAIAGRSPDLFINNSYGSTLACPVPRGIYMCMFPDGDPTNLNSYSVITANSRYTASWIQRMWGYQAEVVYSACEAMGPSNHKGKTILNVGRFFANEGGNHHKRQDVLLQTFIEMLHDSSVDWNLHLIGNIGPSARDQEFLGQLRTAARGQPVEISVGTSFQHLREQYRRAAVYWHGTGFGFSRALEPSKHEHFGMSIVEAMSAGSVPLAFNSGGPREIIRAGVSGYLWNDLGELKMQTLDLIANPDRLRAMSIAAMADSKRFDVRNYLARMDSIIAALVDENSVRW
jgi:glycosyltransferase involved in cell wall biosynthesis